MVPDDKNATLAPDVAQDPGEANQNITLVSSDAMTQIRPIRATNTYLGNLHCPFKESDLFFSTGLRIWGVKSQEIFLPSCFCV